MPKVSVIVPVYNAEKQISKCITSILNQKFEDYELILIDDGSKDGSAVICDEYSRKDNRVLTIHRENAGVSQARNYGLTRARGDYVAFIDADDWIEENYLLNLVGRIKNYDLFISGVIIDTWKDDNLIESHISSVNESRVFTRKELLEAYDKEYPVICLSGPWCKLYRREILNKNNICFDKTMSLGEDVCFNMDYISKCNYIYFDREPGYHYFRENQYSLFNKYRKDLYEIYKCVNEKIWTLFIECKCDKESQDRFICKYIDLMIICLKNAYTNRDKNTSVERQNLIIKIENNAFIKRGEYNSTNIVNRFIYKLLYNKNNIILNLFLNAYYR